jgi:hypothetical protein
MELKYRHHPDGLGNGLKQGLTGFGMSLLGAVAGLIDQPLQAVLQPSLTPSQYLTALMLGITKGVVGAVSKPIAGAADLVSQTGQGEFSCFCVKCLVFQQWCVSFRNTTKSRHAQFPA